MQTHVSSAAADTQFWFHINPAQIMASTYSVPQLSLLAVTHSVANSPFTFDTEQYLVPRSTFIGTYLSS